jgi:hypothetical protein
MNDQDERESRVPDVLELVDFGDARKETKQVWFGQYPDNQFGNGAFPGFKE